MSKKNRKEARKLAKTGEGISKDDDNTVVNIPISFHGTWSKTGLTFVDKEEIPMAFLRIAHVDSENNRRPILIVAKMKNLAMKVGRKMMRAMARRSKTTQI